MPYPSADYNIGLSRGTEFGDDEEERSQAELRKEWISSGMRWFFQEAPRGRNPNLQLVRGGALGLSSSIPVAAAGH
jgi:hypothetical protein